MVEKGLGRESDDVIVSVKAEGLKRFIVQIAIYKVANSRFGWYKRSGMNVVNFILNPKLLETKVKDGAYLLNPLQYYLRSVER